MLMQSIRADYRAFMYVNGQHLGAGTVQLLNDNFVPVQVKKKGTSCTSEVNHDPVS